MIDGSIAVVFGTRPEIIKLAPLARLLGDNAVLIHTGQHFDEELSATIGRDMGVSLPKTTLGVGATSRAQQIGQVLIAAEKAISSAGAVVVQGDTNSALAGALLSNSVEVPLFHVEAGLRSYDRRMPEEHNRVLIDHLADMCWAPTEGNAHNLTKEGVLASRIVQTGNPIVEALASVQPSKAEVAVVLDEFRLAMRDYVLVTLHRPENVDDPVRLELVLRRLSEIPLKVVFPIHPRTMATIRSAGLEELMAGMAVVAPVGYRVFLALIGAARLVISDSGGVQEEVSVLKVPMVVLRRSTERPEVLGTFATLTDDPDEMLDMANRSISMGDSAFTNLEAIPSPYGDGKASLRMFQSLHERGHL